MVVENQDGIRGRRLQALAIAGLIAGHGVFPYCRTAITSSRSLSPRSYQKLQNLPSCMNSLEQIGKNLHLDLAKLLRRTTRMSVRRSPLKGAKPRPEYGSG